LGGVNATKQGLLHCDRRLHGSGWPAGVRDWAGGDVHAAINAVPGGQATALSVVADGGRLVTITGAPPSAQRGVTIVNVYVRAHGGRLARMGGRLGTGEIAISVRRIYGLAEALVRSYCALDA
jgi:hypothetical protein